MLFSLRNQMRDQARSHQEQLRHLQEMMLRIERQLQPTEELLSKPAPQEEVSTHKEPVEDVTLPIPDQAPDIRFTHAPIAGTDVSDAAADIAHDHFPTSRLDVEEAETDHPVPIPEAPRKSRADLERFIGENLINKIGILILITGIGFFIKYAIDKDWIGESGRVMIGLLAGSALVGIAHRLRSGYRPFSSVLAGGGIAVYYFSIAFAFQEYQLIQQPVAFVIMVFITAIAVLLSILYDRVELALLAAIGGFLTPFMVSNGSGNHHVLFSYLLLLNIGLLSLSYYKKWISVHVLSFFATALVYLVWFINQRLGIRAGEIPYAAVFGYITLLYGIFLAMNLIYNTRKKEQFHWLDYSLLLILNLTYFSAGLTHISHLFKQETGGLFCVLLAGIQLVLAAYFKKKQPEFRLMFFFLIGLTLSYVSLAAPVQLSGERITLFWSAELVLLFWLYRRSGIRTFLAGSLIVYVLMAVSLVMDWSAVAGEVQSRIPLLFNSWSGWVTALAASVSYGLYYWHVMQQERTLIWGWQITGYQLRHLFAAVFLITLYITGFFSINWYFHEASNIALPNYAHQLFSALFALVLIGRIRSRQSVRTFHYTAALYFLFTFFELISVMAFGRFQLELLISSGTLFYRLLAVASLAAVLLVVYRVSLQLLSFSGKRTETEAWLSWHNILLVVLLLSNAGGWIYVVLAGGGARSEVFADQFSKAGLTVLWGTCAAVVMWLGMRWSNKLLRIISLILFAVSLAKLFFFDINDLSEGGRITAFILLGILLLGVSFMYQRLKKILMNDSRND